MTQRRLGESYSFIHAIDTAQDTRYTSKIHNAYIHTCAKHRVIEDTFPHRLRRIGCPVRCTRHESCESLGTGLRSIFDRLSSYIQWFCLPILQAICHLLMLIAVEINIDCQVPEGRVQRGEGERVVPTADTFVTNSLKRMLQLPPLLALFSAFEAKVSARYKSIFGTRIW